MDGGAGVAGTHDGIRPEEALAIGVAQTPLLHGVVPSVQPLVRRQDADPAMPMLAAIGAGSADEAFFAHLPNPLGPLASVRVRAATHSVT